MTNFYVLPLLYEKELTSFQQLMHEIKTLDIDGGIRASAKYGGKKCLLFVTRAPNGYGVAVYSTKKDGKTTIPDKRLLIQEIDSEENLRPFLEKIVSKPLGAYSY